MSNIRSISTVIALLVFMASCASDISESQTNITKTEKAHTKTAHIPSTANQPQGNHKLVSTSKGISMSFPWKVTNFYLPPNAALSTEQAETFLFTEAEIGKTTVSYNSQTCHNVYFNTTSISLNNYLLGKYTLSASTLGLQHQQATRVTTNCSIDGFQDYIKLSDGRLLIMTQGIYLFFTPDINY